MALIAIIRIYRLSINGCISGMFALFILHTHIWYEYAVLYNTKKVDRAPAAVDDEQPSAVC